MFLQTVQLLLILQMVPNYARRLISCAWLTLFKSVSFQLESNHSICRENQMTGFYI